MEKIRTFCAFFMLCAIFMSCESEIRVEDVVGKWCLISIESEINGEPSSEPIYLTEGEVYYEFRNDLKYVLNDLGTNECGSWILRNDSLLGTLPNDCEDDSINLKHYLYGVLKSIDVLDEFIEKRANDEV